MNQSFDPYQDAVAWIADTGLFIACGRQQNTKYETPGTWSVVRNAPKRGLTRMAARYALQSLRDTLRL